MQSSNRICSCLHFLVAETRQHAGLISSKQDVLTEPVNLAQHNPISRPANTLINLTPSYICRSAHHTILATHLPFGATYHTWFPSTWA
jgi:hypothetical protein